MVSQSIILEQYPGIVVIMDTDSRLLYSNTLTAKLFGYDSVESMLGIGPHDMKCPAVENADEFLGQDRFVRNKNKIINMFDIHTYADGSVKLLLTKKSPLLEDNVIVGSTCYCTEISSTSLKKIAMQLIAQDKQYQDQTNKKTSAITQTYKIGLTEDEKLTNRETDVVFYMLRGKNSREIADIMFISPRTVEFHIDNIKSKLACNKRSQILEYAIANGYLNYIPEKLLGDEITVFI